MWIVAGVALWALAVLGIIRFVRGATKGRGS